MEYTHVCVSILAMLSFTGLQESDVAVAMLIHAHVCVKYMFFFFYALPLIRDCNLDYCIN